MIIKLIPLFTLATSVFLSACVVVSDNIEQAKTFSAILWKRTTSEYPAITRQVYLLAEKRLRYLHKQALLPDSWAVVLDVDETILNNSAYDMERASMGLPWSKESWSAWVEKRESTVIPGAASFLRLVKSLNGRIALVTNRDIANQAATVDNLNAHGLAFHYLLPMQDNKSDKTERWRWLADNKGLNLIMWIGDQISDFPALQQCQPVADTELSAKSAEPPSTSLSGSFGEALDYPINDAIQQSVEKCAGYNYFILPNPIYGGWNKNLWR